MQLQACLDELGAPVPEVELVAVHEDGRRLKGVLRGPDEWLATFADPVRAQSAIDRFTSNSYDLLIEGESYRSRLKPTLNRCKAGKS